MAQNLTERLIARDWQVTVAAIQRRGQMGDAFRKAGAEVCEGLASWRFDWRPTLRLKEIIRSQQIQTVIILDAVRNGLFHALAAVRLSKTNPATICWCHSTVGVQAGNVAGRLAAACKFGRLGKIVCPSNRPKQMLIKSGLPAERIDVIHNGIDVSTIAAAASAGLSISKGKKLIVQVANFMPDKDFASLIEAAALLAARRNDFHLMLVGRDTDCDEVKRMVSSAGVESFVMLAGARDDVPSVLAAADIFVLSTHSEVFSVSTLEAMAAGRAIVVSDIPAFEEMLTNSQDCIKAMPANSAALAGAIETLLDQSQLRQQLGQAAKKRVEQFSLDKMTDEFEKLITSCT